jgi:hypothetical protein
LSLTLLLENTSRRSAPKADVAEVMRLHHLS